MILYHVARARTFFAGMLHRPRTAAVVDSRRSTGDVLAAAAATTTDGRVGRFWYHAWTGTFFADKKHYKAMRVECGQDARVLAMQFGWLLFYFYLMLFGALIASAGAVETSNTRLIISRNN
uniref:Uncharacterized protein n=1 Tax=Oryza punctata TaxID=4537 RepID=A0A0E0LND0_ORYPU